MGADSGSSCDTSEEMAALVDAVPQLRALNLHNCATRIRNAGTCWLGTRWPHHMCAVRFCAAGYDSWCTVHHAELCQMSKLGKLQHLIECFNECVDHSLDAALATLTGAPSLQATGPQNFQCSAWQGCTAPPHHNTCRHTCRQCSW